MYGDIPEYRLAEIDRQIAQDHDRAIEKARKMVAGGLLIVDTETTGLGSQDEIVEIAVVDLDGEVLLDTLVKPTISVPAESSRIHGIVDADLAQASTMADLLLPLYQISGSRGFTSYNVAFDSRMLQRSLVAAGARRPPGWEGARFNWQHCIMELYAQYYGEWSEHHGSYTLQSLARALDQCRLTADGPMHRALGDAQAALTVLKHMAT